MALDLTMLLYTSWLTASLGNLFLHTGEALLEICVFIKDKKQNALLTNSVRCSQTPESCDSVGLAADGWHKLILMQKLLDSRLDSR